MLRRFIAAPLAGFALHAQALPVPATPTAPDAPLSAMALPIRVELPPLFKAVDAQAPISPPNVETWAPIQGHESAWFRFNLIREPLQLRLRDDELGLRVKCHFGMDVGVKLASYVKVVGSCGRAPEEPRTALLSLRTRVALTPQWQFELRDLEADVVPLDTCKVTFVGYDITDQVAAGMQQNLVDAARAFEKLVAGKALVRQKAEEAWSLLQKPVEIRKGAWLLMDPVKLRMAPPHTEGDTLVITPQLLARPRVLLGDPPPAGTAPLPDLEVGPVEDPDFHVRVEARLPYPDATLQLTELMSGMQVPTSHGTLQIQSVALRAQQDRLVIELNLTGAMEGIVLLEGRPTLDADGLPRLDDLDFTLDSHSWIQRTGAWLLHSSLRRTLQDQVTKMLAQEVQQVRDLAQANLNRNLGPGMDLAGSLDKLRVDAIVLEPDALHTFAAADGQLTLKVSQAPTLPVAF